MNEIISAQHVFHQKRKHPEYRFLPCLVVIFFNVLPCFILISFKIVYCPYYVVRIRIAGGIGVASKPNFLYDFLSSGIIIAIFKSRYFTILCKVHNLLATQ
jgi:hypothetical protein